MILYFTGTGNSRYAANIIGAILNDTVVSMNDMMRSGNHTLSGNEKPLVIVCPVYAWRIAKPVTAFIKTLHLSGNRNVYFVVTCGGDIGNTEHYIRKLCRAVNLKLMGVAPVVMPGNYIAFSTAPDKNKAKPIIEKAQGILTSIAQNIAHRNHLPSTKVTLKGNIRSRLINPLFYAFNVRAKGFHSTNACIGCGKCAEICPLCNISIVEKAPVWGNKCTHCMACICYCPQKAIEYKNNTQGKTRYYNDGIW